MPPDGAEWCDLNERGCRFGGENREKITALRDIMEDIKLTMKAQSRMLWGLILGLLAVAGTTIATLVTILSRGH